MFGTRQLLVDFTIFNLLRTIRKSSSTYGNGAREKKGEEEEDPRPIEPS
jgi:hypothetical protein